MSGGGRDITCVWESKGQLRGFWGGKSGLQACGAHLLAQQIILQKKMLWSSIKMLTNAKPKQRFYFLVFSQQSQVLCKHEHVHLLQWVDKHPFVAILLKTIHVIQTEKTSWKEVTGTPYHQILSRQLMR